MSVLQITRDEARWLATIAQGLDRRPFSRRVRKADILDVFDRLGCIQLDTISVISRSHQTVLWSRLGTYDPSLIVDLYDPDLQLTEYWAHAAAIISVSMLPLFRQTMQDYRESREWHESESGRLVAQRVFDRILEAGPISSRDFDVPEGVDRASAWDWYGNKVEREALAELWTSGHLMVRKREPGFARVYDLAENVVPGFWSADPVSQDYRQRALASRAIRALGVISASWTADYFRSGKLIYLNV
ncbi:MAG: crosslink repair DNA glycosylase YcaQ family protein, partial [Thermomicrobiales bacterium]